MPITKATASSIAPAAKGDLVVGSATNDAGVLAVGTNTHILVADSTETLGMKWAAPASSGDNWTLLNAGGTALTGATTITVSGISNKEKLHIMVEDASAGTASDIGFRFNTNTGSVYYVYGGYIESTNPWATGNLSAFTPLSTTIQAGRGNSTNGNSKTFASLVVTGCASATSVKSFQLGVGTTGASGYNVLSSFGGGYINITAAITSVSIVSSVGNFDLGTIYVYANA